jgi:hypothetical protein
MKNLPAIFLNIYDDLKTGFGRTNSVKWEADVGGARVPVGHALCPIFSLLCHSCISNTRQHLKAKQNVEERQNVVFKMLM